MDKKHALAVAKEIVIVLPFVRPASSSCVAVRFRFFFPSPAVSHTVDLNGAEPVWEHRTPRRRLVSLPFCGSHISLLAGAWRIFIGKFPLFRLPQLPPRSSGVHMYRGYMLCSRTYADPFSLGFACTDSRICWPVCCHFTMGRTTAFLCLPSIFFSLHVQGKLLSSIRLRTAYTHIYNTVIE